MTKYVQRESDYIGEDFNCDICNSSGWVSLYTKDTLDAYAFRCTCAKGRKLSNKIPFYTNQKIKEKVDVELTHKEFMDENKFRTLNKITKKNGPQKNIVKDIVNKIGTTELDEYLLPIDDPKRKMDYRWDDNR